MTGSKQRITVLGSTGSIGTNTLDVIARNSDAFEVYALCAATQVQTMLQQCAQFKPQFAVMANAQASAELAQRLKAEGLPTRVLDAPNAVCAISQAPEVDMVMAAIVGAAGLEPCLAAARAGKRLLLANKEALVVGGELFMSAVRAGGATLLPIDSEHSAIFQALPEDPSTWARRVEKIILTASGGPFRTREAHTLRDVTPAQAVAHPNWVMGRKISVDSATMMNKALEVIEAHHLFNAAPERLDVVIHPQSVVHSMVQFNDRSVVAQLGTPDMRVPIAYGLSWPERIASGAQAMDFAAMANLTFELPCPKRFPGLFLAWDALRGPAGSTAVLNAANEVAVQAFLDERIRFDQIVDVNKAVLNMAHELGADSVEALLALDASARRGAQALVSQWSSGGGSV
ncbi:MAG: 1-deoxy-D-xylulose-5-phosphate reductoisomerase [Burkholderiaceae bacterium]|jgi:1-deoxy-D-xylulose-5-phosphate reductoisomerase|nr:1-deoxy-D-xylulose-5-phosphate reductoisomerase [Burkholderiaceae bacterium]